MKKLALIACCLLICFMATTAHAVNSVVIESRVIPAAASCTVGVFITNDVPINGIVLPFETRRVTGGPDSAGYYGIVLRNVLWNYTPNGRLKNSPLGDAPGPDVDPEDGTPDWPAATVVRNVYLNNTDEDTAQANPHCGGPENNAYAISTTSAGASAPDGMLLAAVSVGNPDNGEKISLPPGADAAGTPSMRFIFQKLTGVGCFIIDTVCMQPANHLVYVDEFTTEVTPAFTPGFVSVGGGTCEVIQNQSPTAVCQNVQVSADANCQGTATPAMFDNGSNDPEDGFSVSFSMFPSPPFALGQTVVNLVVTDSQGAADTCQATLTVVDSTSPSITCPGDMTFQCPTQVPAPYANTDAFIAAGGSVSDNCGNSPVTLLNADTAGTCPMVITRQYVATDGAGNQDTCAQTITVNDTIAPDIVDCPNDTIINLPNGQTSTVVVYSDAGIIENCSNVFITHAPLSGSTFNVGTTNVRLIASDDCGNADTCFFDVTVNELPAENTPPTAVCQNVQVGTDANCQAVVIAAQVNNGSSDNETAPGNLILTLEPAGPYALGVTNVSLIVTDEGALADTCEATITVVDDDNPSIACPGPISVQCSADIPAPYDSAGFLSAGGTFSDNCGSVDWSYMGQVSDGQSCPEMITRTYRVMDAAGNFVECTQTITVDDTTPPSVTCNGDTTVIIFEGTNIAVVYGPATSTDNCDPDPTEVCNPPSGALFPVGVTTVTCTATDDCGNVDSCSFTITVQVAAAGPPEALCTDVKVDADSTCTADADINNGSFDPDGGPVTTTQTPPGPYPLGTTQVLLTVEDEDGETDTCSALVTVNDVTPPVVTCPADIFMNNDPGVCGAVFNGKFEAPSATDNCDQDITITQNPDYGAFLPVGVTQIEVIATDDDGNADTCYYNVTVNDVEDPVIACPQVDMNVNNDPGQCGAIVNYDLDVTDNCPGITETYSPPSGSFFPVGSTQVRLIATDDAGNADTCFFNVIVNDTEDPVMTCPVEVIVQAPFGSGGAVVTWSSSASDNCPGVLYECDSTSGSFFLVGGPYMVCCVATDAAGNADTCCFPVTVLPPSQEVPGPQVANPEDDTLTFKLTCGCDSQSVELICTEVDVDSCFYLAETTVPGISFSPNPGYAPGSVDVIACATGVAGTVEGWVYIHNAAGAISDSLYVIFEVNPDVGGVSVVPDTLKFTYTGDLFNDKLCLPIDILSNGCSETCWFYEGGGGDWVWVDPTSGSTPGTPEVCVTPCSLLAGVYYDTLYFCECGKQGASCDQLIVELTVVDPPVLVVDPLNLLFEINCEQKALPLPVEVSNGGGGVIDWTATWDANWFNVEPSDGTIPNGPDSFYVSLNPDSIKCPDVCDTLIDSICVTANKGCAINGQQYVIVELRICPPPDTVECDSICGWVSDASCLNKTDCHIDDATVELWTSYPDGVLITSTQTVGGRFCFDVEPGAEYDIRVWKKGYCTDVVGPWTCERGEVFIDLVPIDFVPLPNWPYFTDYYSSDATSEGFPIQPGDVIYATDPQGVICGITYVEADSAGTYLIHVLGDDPKTPEDEGAVFGDSITLWLNCECPVVAPDTWVNFGSFRFDAAWDCRPTGICCELCEGWNMWSYNIQLPDYAREAVLATIDLNYDAVRSGLCDYGSISWFANRPINDLEDVTPWYGYDIHMLEADTVCIEGEVIDPSTPIYLCEGWNYIPYLPMEADNLGHALESLDGNYAHIFTIICGYGVASWNELRDPVNNDLVCMESCKGYWIKMKSEDTLIYPANAEGCLFTAKLAANSTSGRVTATPMVADYYAGSSNLNAGSVISVRTSSGILVGEGTVGANGAFLVHVYGDVPQTSQVEGAVYGEELSFEVNGMAAGAGTSVNWLDRDNREISLTVDEAAAVPTEYALLQNYPNPFNAGTVMPFVMKDASQWTLTVYNIMGQTVQTFEGFDAAGTIRVSWDGQDRNGSTVPSGVYFYRVTTANWAATKKMTLLK